MNQIRLYLDEDTLSTVLIRTLLNAEFDIMTAADVNMLGVPDEDQLIWASSQNRVIYSFNIGDFCRLHRDFMMEGKNHAGIILGSQQKFSIGEQLKGFRQFILSVSTEIMVNNLVFLRDYL